MSRGTRKINFLNSMPIFYLSLLYTHTILHIKVITQTLFILHVWLLLVAICVVMWKFGIHSDINRSHEGKLISCLSLIIESPACFRSMLSPLHILLLHLIISCSSLGFAITHYCSKSLFSAASLLQQFIVRNFIHFKSIILNLLTTPMFCQTISQIFVSLWVHSHQAREQESSSLPGAKQEKKRLRLRSYFGMYFGQFYPSSFAIYLRLVLNNHVPVIYFRILHFTTQKNGW